MVTKQTLSISRPRAIIFLRIFPIFADLNLIVMSQIKLCKVLEDYSKSSIDSLNLPFNPEGESIPVVELFAGVGGFRIGLERASKRFETIWNNQWEPSTKRQDAFDIYGLRFGDTGHDNRDIATVPLSDIPDCQLLVGGFPCQDYSVATTLNRSGGIQGKKGVLWWQIHRILTGKTNKPSFLLLENVDRLIKSPANQRGRDFAIILSSLSDLGYCVEWRVINAADYGMPQRRKRTYIVAYKTSSVLGNRANNTKDKTDWIFNDGVIAKAFPAIEDTSKRVSSSFKIKGSLLEVSENFNAGARQTLPSPFEDAGFMFNRQVWTATPEPVYSGPRVNLGDILLPEDDYTASFRITPEAMGDEDNPAVGTWRWLKGHKVLPRIDSNGHQYNYSEGAMACPDFLDRPSRTVITGEGGAAPSRFKHVIQTNGYYRRLTPIELERLDMFPDNHTKEASDLKRAFLMGNALVTGIVERLGVSIISCYDAEI